MEDKAEKSEKNEKRSVMNGFVCAYCMFRGWICGFKQNAAFCTCTIFLVIYFFLLAHTPFQIEKQDQKFGKIHRVISRSQ